MNRLREESGLDPISEKGIEMLRSVRPTVSSPLMKRRVWAALQESSIASPVRQRSLLRALVVGVGLVAFTATAAATIGGRRIAARIEKLLSPQGAAGVGMGAAQPRSERTKPVRIVAEAESAPEVQPDPELGVSELPAKADSRMPLAGSAPSASAHSALRPSRAVPVAVEARERAQVWEALVALRRDHDPNRAAALLNHELEANPHGVLRQEALVLAIEAADARGDRGGAEGFARAYEREFPSGRFRQLAQRYLDEKNARVRALPSKQ
ncbi:MAG TPA: hypothetical protein VLC06_12305 [Polyangia bacterium]|nr:hypothetical protein [Polyangia bacterium]